jgi:hypothetical protein
MIFQRRAQEYSILAAIELSELYVVWFDVFTPYLIDKVGPQAASIVQDATVTSY